MLITAAGSLTLGWVSGRTLRRQRACSRVRIAAVEPERLDPEHAIWSRLKSPGVLGIYPGCWRHDQHDEPGAVPGGKAGKLSSKRPILAKGRVEPYDELVAVWQIAWKQCTAFENRYAGTLETFPSLVKEELLQRL